MTGDVPCWPSNITVLTESTKYHRYHLYWPSCYINYMLRLWFSRLTFFSQDVLRMETEQGRTLPQHVWYYPFDSVTFRHKLSPSLQRSSSCHSFTQTAAPPHLSRSERRHLLKGSKCFGTSPRGVEFSSVSIFLDCKYNPSPFIRAPEGERRHFKASLFRCPQAPSHEITAVQQKG